MVLISCDEEGILRENRDAPPSHYLFKVESFSLFSKNGIEKCESKSFEAGDHHWKIVFFPNGDNCGNGRDHVSIYLAMTNTSSLPAGGEVNAVFRFFLFDQIRGNYLTVQGSARRFDMVKSEWGFSKFIPLNAFTQPSNGYLVSDTCFFGVEVFVIKSSGLGESLSISEFNKSYKYKWKISQFSKLAECCCSRIFSVGGYKWKLCLYPKGNKQNKDCSLSLYMVSLDSKNSGPAQKLKAEYTLTLKDKINRKHHQHKATIWFGASNKKWGWSSFIQLKDLNDCKKGFIIEDRIVVEAKVTVLAEILQKSLIC